MQPSSFIIAVFEFVLLIFSLSVHECAHAWMASRLGDQTARLQGRITLNPMYHIDPIGTLLFPALMIFGPFIGFGFLGGFLIGWAKPTPVITRNFRKIVRDDNSGHTGRAGLEPAVWLWPLCRAGRHHSSLPKATVVLAGVHCRLQATGPLFLSAFVLLCQLAILVNLSLFFFNLLPIPPLDGSRIVRNMLPYNAVQVLRPDSHLDGLPAHDLRWRPHC